MKDDRRQMSDGKFKTVPTLPASSILSPTERAEIERHVAELEALCAQTPVDADRWEGETLIVITKLMLALPAAAQNEAGAEATGEAFQVALDDMPTWAVAAAVRRWYRGECGENEKGLPYDYHWRPAPAELRRVAFAERWRVLSRVKILRALLATVPAIEFSDEHCAEMRTKLGELFQTRGIQRAADSVGKN